jgi:hypothetical protein
MLSLSDCLLAPCQIPAFKWVVRDNLLPASKEGQGHYRRVNGQVWAAFCDMYKGSGPAIRYVRARALLAFWQRVWHVFARALLPPFLNILVCL